MTPVERVAQESEIPVEYLTTLGDEYGLGEPYTEAVVLRYHCPEDIQDRWYSYTWRMYFINEKARRAKLPPYEPPEGPRVRRPYEDQPDHWIYQALGRRKGR